MAWEETELDERDMALQGLSWAILHFFEVGGTLDEVEKVATACAASKRRAEAHHQFLNQLQPRDQ